jgi:hypothetical protein
MNSDRRITSGRRLLLVSGAAALLLGMAPARGPGAPQMPTGLNPSCPHDAHYVVRNLFREDSVVVMGIQVAGSIADIPEFHDCQRLLQGSGSGYGTLAGIYASERLEMLEDSIARLIQSHRVNLAVAAAQVFSYDSGYAPLGIRRLHNCLYMGLTFAQAGPKWRAWMVPAGVVGERCLLPLDPSSGAGTELFVMEMPEATDLPSADVPPVARWNWSVRGNTQTIGIKCGSRWCEIGRHDFGPSPHFSAGTWPPGRPVLGQPVQSSHRRRVMEVRGWYDQQRLARAAAGSPTNATTLEARVIPDPRTDSYSDADFANGTWLPSGYVVMPAPRNSNERSWLAEYRTKFGFGVGWNTISLCARDAATCLPEGVSLTCSTPAGAQRWYGRVEDADGRVRYLCVARRQYSVPAGVRVPRTARWRWTADDETVWVGCTQGCCELET